MSLEKFSSDLEAQKGTKRTRFTNPTPNLPGMMPYYQLRIRDVATDFAVVALKCGNRWIFNELKQCIHFAGDSEDEDFMMTTDKNEFIRSRIIPATSVIIRDIPWVFPVRDRNQFLHRPRDAEWTLFDYTRWIEFDFCNLNENQHPTYIDFTRVAIAHLVSKMDTQGELTHGMTLDISETRKWLVSFYDAKGKVKENDDDLFEEKPETDKSVVTD